MLRYGLATLGILVSSQAFATSTYVCSSTSRRPTGDAELTASWNVGTVSKIPSTVFVGYKGALVYGKDSMTAVDGFWMSDKRLWIELRGTEPAPSMIIKAVNSGEDRWTGEARLSNGQKLAVTCIQRG